MKVECLFMFKLMFAKIKNKKKFGFMVVFSTFFFFFFFFLFFFFSRFLVHQKIKKC